jgi:hypothetical protein
MGGDDQKRRATTKRFTREELAELADKVRGEHAAEVVDAAAPDAVQPEITPMSRSQTLHDPMTTQLLAEVARRLQTMELEVEPGALPLETDEPDVAHPHLRRRRT